MSVARDSLRLAGFCLSVACITWVGWNFYSAGVLHEGAAQPLAENLPWRIACASALYMVAVVSLGFAWVCLQRVFVGDVPSLPSACVYLVTQAYKYLPGGVVQYVGRHVALRQLGMSHVSLALCAVTEAGCLVAVALQFSASFVGHIDSRISGEIVRVGVVLAACVAVALATWLHRRIPWIAARIPVIRVRWLMLAMLLYALFFLLMSWTLTSLVPDAMAVHLPWTGWAAAAAASWIAGFIVVGAPAGLGVREVVFVTLLTGVAAKPVILVVAAGFRVATFAGDILACLFGLLVSRYLRLTAERKRGTPSSRGFRSGH